MGPVIAIIGKPNVGKSSLFNRLIKEEKAIVADFSGSTRDRLYGNFSVSGFSYTLVDTGGILENVSEMNSLVLDQVNEAILEADGFIFLLDASQPMNKLDININTRLRKSNKNYLIVANKSELKSARDNLDEFYKLNKNELIKISAKNGKGIKELKDNINEVFPSRIEKVSSTENEVKICILGKPNAGKSTFFNQILKSNRSIVSRNPGTTRDPVLEITKFKSGEVSLIDTAGLRKKSKISQDIEIFSVTNAIKSMRSSSGVIYLLDGKESLTDQDLHLISLTISSGKPLIIGINKSDLLSKYDKSILTRALNLKLRFAPGIEIKYLSAKDNKGTSSILNALVKLVKRSKNKMDTSNVNKIFQEAFMKNVPPMKGRFRPKLKYVSLVNQSPLIIKIQGNNLDSLTIQYLKYLENYFRKVKNLKGIPIKIITKNNKNPYSEKKNILTKKQLAKRKRVRRH